MLVYHPVYDVNHCLYRMLLVLEASAQEEFEWDTFKLMNFYLVFPHLLKDIKPLPAALSSYRKAINGIPNSYAEIPNPKRTLFDLSALQNMAASHLAAKSIVNLDFHRLNIIRKEQYELSSKLQTCLHSDPVREQLWFKVITDELPLLDMRGKHGLKKRSGLMEYQYDVEDKKAS
ncbi:ABC-three component system middle component 5 [Thalassospira marina]|uniref:Uncharacterized protein n=1 Tax=Thalassospira marina TaxID=2048283 RepID=A0A2N3KS56_9PROT|nr:ABC-three component system middle component 5 [Thalassospira marina]PKR53326.1 hypothetical protein COO20_14610 [Thalassospira marina]